MKGYWPCLTIHINFQLFDTLISHLEPIVVVWPPGVHNSPFIPNHENNCHEVFKYHRLRNFQIMCCPKLHTFSSRDCMHSLGFISTPFTCYSGHSTALREMGNTPIHLFHIQQQVLSINVSVKLWATLTTTCLFHYIIYAVRVHSSTCTIHTVYLSMASFPYHIGIPSRSSLMISYTICTAVSPLVMFDMSNNPYIGQE